MKRLLIPALLALTAACSSPEPEQISITRADLPGTACPQTDVIAGCPEVEAPLAPGKAAYSAGAMGAALTRSLMRLF